VTEQAFDLKKGETDGAFVSLKQWFKQFNGALVAFSGGIDSSLLLAGAVAALGDRALAVTAVSASYPDEERKMAEKVAALIRARHMVIESKEMDNPLFKANPPERCYHCKDSLFRDLQKIAGTEGLEIIVDGSNAGDGADFRPGAKAARRHSVRSPLAELGFHKGLIRETARRLGLPNWDAPSCACLASRVPYGTAITAEKLTRIGSAERELRGLGLKTVRARDYGDTIRIETGKDEIEKFLSPDIREKALAACKKAGYIYVCLDIEGYRTGSMNSVLTAAQTSLKNL
jgi:uncharacterized protein